MSAPTSRKSPVVPIVIGAVCLFVVLVLVVAGIAGVFFYRAVTGSDTSGGVSTSSGLPPGVEEGQPYLELSSSDGPVVDIYLDFACPHCADFVAANGEDARAMAESDEITLRIHPRPMLDSMTSPTGYSSRAANAAVCAYAADGYGDPSAWFDAEQALIAEYANGPSMNDAELADVVFEATGLDVTDCIVDETYVDWIQDVVEPEAQESTQGTPAIMIDGALVEIDTASEGSLRKAVEEA